MARDTIPDDGDRKVVSVKVRDASGKIVVTTTLTLVIETAPEPLTISSRAV